MLSSVIISIFKMDFSINLTKSINVRTSNVSEVLAFRMAMAVTKAVTKAVAVAKVVTEAVTDTVIMDVALIVAKSVNIEGEGEGVVNALIVAKSTNKYVAMECVDRGVGVGVGVGKGVNVCEGEDEDVR